MDARRHELRKKAKWVNNHNDRLNGVGEGEEGKRLCPPPLENFLQASMTRYSTRITLTRTGETGVNE